MMNFIVFDNFTWRGIRRWSKYASAAQNKIMCQISNYELLHLYGFYKNSLSEKISKQISVAVIPRNATFIPANYQSARLLLLISLIAYLPSSLSGGLLFLVSGICKAVTCFFDVKMEYAL